MKKAFTYFYQAINIFLERGGSNLAAASSFYVVISVVPLILLTVRLVGYAIGDVERGQEELFYYLNSVFPDVAPEVLERVKEMVAGPLFGGARFTIINLFVLFLSSLSFFNSIWSGLFQITQDKSYLSFWRNLKGIIVIGITIGLITLSLSLPTLFVLFVKMAQDNFVVSFLWELMPFLRPLLEHYQNYNLEQSFLLKSNLLYGVLFIFYFMFLYRWFFSWKVPMLNALIASLCFVISLFVGKNLFLLYVYYVRDNLIRNYGDFYTAILALMWVFFVMCFFYFGACLCYVMKDEPTFRNLKALLAKWKRKLKPRAS